MAKKRSAEKQKPVPTDTTLRGWNDIARYLGQPVATAQRWAKTGMPVRRAGRNVVTEPEELDRWLGRESGMAGPAHVVHAEASDLVSDLKAGLTAARKQRRK